MTHSTIFGYALAVSIVLASAGVAAEPAASNAPSRAVATVPTAPAAGERKTTLQRANDDVLRQLRPSGLKRHAQGFGALAKRGCDDLVSKVSGKPAQH